MYLSNIESDSTHYSNSTNPRDNRGPQVGRFIPLLSVTCFNTLTPKCRETSLMAEMRKVEEGSAFPEKRKLDQPNSTNKALEEMKEVKEDDGFDSKKKQKLEFPAENEKCIIIVTEKIVESKDGKEGYKGNENGNEDVHLKVESEIVDKGKRIAAADKGKAILIEESEEEGGEEEDNSDTDDYDDYDYDSSDDSDSDFSDGLGDDSEYDLAN